MKHLYLFLQRTPEFSAISPLHVLQCYGRFLPARLLRGTQINGSPDDHHAVIMYPR